MDTPTFYVRDIPIYGDVILSPMAGYSDVPYRAICRTFGSAMHYTEFVPVEALVGKKNRFWARLDQRPEDDPMVFQIFGNDAQKILSAAQRIEALEPDIIDINMGCSTRRVSGRGAGVGMMKTPDLIADTFRLLSTHLNVPVTGKIRLGWEENRNYLEVGKILEDNGASLVAIHGRTKEQKYNGLADWDAIAELKQSLSIPVIGNGDIFTPDDIDRMLSYTGCDAVMIGRGAIGNPWIFSRIPEEAVSYQMLYDTIQIHFKEMMGYHGEKHGIPMFRKHFKRYIERLPTPPAELPAMLRVGTAAEFLSLLEQLFADIEGLEAARQYAQLGTPLEFDESCEVTTI